MLEEGVARALMHPNKKAAAQRRGGFDVLLASTLVEREGQIFVAVVCGDRNVAHGAGAHADIQ